ncbi:hypothetical protein B0J13DRAFT_623634 [Dactylonectria estremocensis]|uniref:Uncharacterized protein n=1 Tax=Dactylonectria estremocensis TaxID=1079267 RepID=A0A9P9IZ64_9HYPO|nr:hypothetical protein B0J13DRAFT_623634 [Dactylonectria estremocensis]
MSRWGIRMTDTAKVSIEARYMLADRTRGMLDNLKALRTRALGHATLADIGAFAAIIPLPAQNLSEERDLFDDSFQSTVKPEANSIDTKLYSINDIEYEHTEQFAEESEYDTDSDSGDNDNTDAAGLAGPSYEELFSSQNATADTSSPPQDIDSVWSHEETCDTDQVKDVDDDAMNQFLYVPWIRSFPAKLKLQLDRIDTKATLELKTSALEGAQTTGDSESSKTATKSTPQSLDSESITSSQESCCSRRSHNHCAVSTKQLVRIQKCVEHIESFHDTVWRGIETVKSSLNRRRARYRLAKYHGDLTGFMKSRGMGSPLTDVIGIDEAWPSTGWTNWGTPVRNRKDLMVL